MTSAFTGTCIDVKGCVSTKRAVQTCLALPTDITNPSKVQNQFSSCCPFVKVESQIVSLILQRMPPRERFIMGWIQIAVTNVDNELPTNRIIRASACDQIDIALISLLSYLQHGIYHSEYRIFPCYCIA